MAVSIAGIRFKNLILTPDAADGSIKTSGAYDVMGSNGKPFASQNINGYNDVKLVASPATVKAFDAAVAAFKLDIETQLGLSE